MFYLVNAMQRGKMISIVIIGLILFSLFVFYPEEVKAEEIDYIVIMDGRYNPGGFGEWVGPSFYPLGNNYTFYAASYNYTSGFLGYVDVNWTSSDPAVGSVSTPGYSTLFNTVGLGTCIVTAEHGGGFTNSTGILTIAKVDEITIRDGPDGEGDPVMDRSYYLGDPTETDVYWAASYNDTYGFLDDVAVTWTSSNTSVAEPSAGLYELTYLILNGVGTCYIIADYGGGITDTTGTITVWTYEVDYIVVVHEIWGYGETGEWVGPTVYPEGGSDRFYAASYNYTGGYIGLVEVDWTSSDPSVGSVSPTGYYTSFNALSAGTCIVTADYGGGITNETGVLTVASVDEIIIRDAADDGGNEVSDEEYYVGRNVTFYSAGYNDTYGYLGEVDVLWSSNDTYVGTVTSPGKITYFHAKHEGTCFVTADYGSGISDTTGILTVYMPYNYTVDDDGPADFSTIQEAIDHARDGDTIFVYEGTYLEHLIINKSISLIGAGEDSAYIDGEGSGTVIYVSGDDVTITGFTIKRGEYGIFLDESVSFTITYNTITNYTTGIYHNRTEGGYVAHNTITQGENGIVTIEAYNDAIRYNTISYNTVYGAKDYNSQLTNCFNWNYFYYNYIAYYYDPDVVLDTLEFDGNVIENSYIGIKVAEASYISITNNTIINSEYGIYVINASPYIGNNVIKDAKYGIYTENASPVLFENDISEISEHGIYSDSADSLVIINNNLENTRIFVQDSKIEELWLKDTILTKINSQINITHLDTTSGIEEAWFLKISVGDEEGNSVYDAAILIYDAFDNLVSTQFSDENGNVEPILLTGSFQDYQSTTSYNPYRIIVLKDTFETGAYDLTMEEDKTLAVSLEKEAMMIKTSGSEFPWASLIAVGFIGLLGGLGASALLFEVMKYGLLTLFLPLYSRINKSNVLDQPTRYKILGYIIGNPGAHFGLIKHDLELGNGQLADHIRHLTKAHMVYAKEDGIKKRFYPVGYPKKEDGTHPFSVIHEKIFGIIKSNSGISQKKLASEMGISRQVAGYHLTKMENEGIIEKEIVGRESRYYPSESVSV
jgi:parallel beta-helix repeat protein